jgi:ribosome-binding protein aMBF1 (putative translation factor)
MTSISDSQKKRSRGRPRTGIGKPIGLRLYPKLEAMVDTWARLQPDKPARPKAIRRLIEIALKGSEMPREQDDLKVSGRQVKAARVLKGWSQEQLAAAAAVSIPTIKRLEAQDGPMRGRAETGSKIRAALEVAGVEFIDENGGGSGVRLRMRHQKMG